MAPQATVMKRNGQIGPSLLLPSARLKAGAVKVTPFKPATIAPSDRAATPR